MLLAILFAPAYSIIPLFCYFAIPLFHFYILCFEDSRLVKAISSGWYFCTVINLRYVICLQHMRWKGLQLAWTCIFSQRKTNVQLWQLPYSLHPQLPLHCFMTRCLDWLRRTSLMWLWMNSLVLTCHRRRGLHAPDNDSANVSSQNLLFMRFGKVADSKSLLCVLTFSTRILTLAIVWVSIACCSVNICVPLKNYGMVKNTLLSH